MTDYGVLEADVVEASAELWELWCTELGASGSEWLSGADVALPGGPHPAPPPREASPAPGQVRIRHYFVEPPAGAPGEWVAGYRARFPEAAAPQRIVWNLRPVEAWSTQWRKHFAPLCIGQRLMICPPWDDGRSLDGGAAVPRLRIVIDPGQGFGTGRHASTVLALELLERCLGEGAAAHVPRRMLDVGTGSGILLIAARLLGVAEGVGLDIDARVAPEVRANLRLSGLAGRDRIAVGSPAAVRGAFPLVTANITAPVLTHYAADLRRLTSAGGHLILSGMLADEIESVLAQIAIGGWRRTAQSGTEGWAAAWLTRHG